LALPRSTAEGAKHPPHLQHAPRPTVRESAKARGRRARGDRQGVPSLRGSKDIPQFTPNFSVYLLPPDAVCLYSEDRKFFLHGELYCALASAIGNGGRSFRDLFGELERKYPSDKIQEAFTRLLDRRYLVQTSSSSKGTASAYWASLGLPLETAQKNLQNCRVSITSKDVQGAKQLESALREFGVRIVKRSGDLTVMLVNDYLDEDLAELNKQHCQSARRGCSSSHPGSPRSWGRCSVRAKARAGGVLRIAWAATARSGRCSTAAMPAASPFPHWPSILSAAAPFSLPPSKSRRRLPPISEPS
jgi:hypothetical protein